MPYLTPDEIAANGKRPSEVDAAVMADLDESRRELAGLRAAISDFLAVDDQTATADCSDGDNVCMSREHAIRIELALDTLRAALAGSVASQDERDCAPWKREGGGETVVDLDEYARQATAVTDAARAFLGFRLRTFIEARTQGD